MATVAQPNPQPEIHHLARKPLVAEVVAAPGIASIDLLSLALSKDAAIDVIERLAVLHREERMYQAQVAFDEALNRCQAKLGRVSADATNPSTRSRYASYAKLDSVTRPIYTAENFSLSFGERDCPTPGKTRFVAYLSRCGVTREYLKDMSPSTEGPRGGEVMTPIHADAAADSYAKRYLLKDIFNIAIGDGDTDGNATTNGEIAGYVERLKAAKTRDDLYAVFKEVYPAVNGDQNLQRILIDAKDARKRELR